MHILEGIEDCQYTTSQMLQVYLGDKAGTRLRGEIITNVLCHTRCKFTQTVKKGEGISRPENEHPIKRDHFMERIKKRAFDLRKTRIFIPVEGRIVDLNIFHDRCLGKEVRVPIENGDIPYRQIEVESKSLHKLRAFVPPPWFGREVTDDPRHSSYSIARFGAPEEDTIL